MPQRVRCATRRRKARQFSNYANDGENKMLEKIRTFIGRAYGIHQNKKTVVEQGSAWYCKYCRMVFITKEAGEQHKCQDQKPS